MLLYHQVLQFLALFSAISTQAMKPESKNWRREFKRMKVQRNNLKIELKKMKDKKNKLKKKCNIKSPPSSVISCRSKNPVTLKLSEQRHSLIDGYNAAINATRLSINGGNLLNTNCTNDVIWFNQSNFWYLEVQPVKETGQTCPIQGGGNTVAIFKNGNVSAPPTCNTYDFRLLIDNNLTDPTTVHYHGLTPPTNEDGVPFVTNPNIEPMSLQYYRFAQLTYPGMYWMHSHWGFHAVQGIAAPIIFQHGKNYLKQNEDFIVQLEDSVLYPKCVASPKYLYKKECDNISQTDWYNQVFFINEQVKPLEFTPDEDTETVRIRFLNAGASFAWNVYNNCNDQCDYSYMPTMYVPPMEIIAVDGNDMKRDLFRNNFFIGIANRHDVLIKVNSQKDTLITAIANNYYGKESIYRHIIIHGKNNNNPIIASRLINNTAMKSDLNSFDLAGNLSAIHTLANMTQDQNLREYSIITRGGDEPGGFPLSIYKGSVKNGNIAEIVRNETNFLYPVSNYTQLNEQKYLLMPNRVWEHNVSKQIISSKRGCNLCVNNINKKSGTGIVNKPPASNNYALNYDFAPPDLSKPTCCWEWCDVDEAQCDNYKVKDVDEYKTNQHYIPVCYGDRVRITFVNSSPKSHPIHLHGHDFIVRELGGISVRDNFLNVSQTVVENGPIMDTIWLNSNTTVTFEFDAFNAGEHLLHCHKDFHLANGMLTTVRYINDHKICKNVQDLPTNFYGGENNLP